VTDQLVLVLSDVTLYAFARQPAGTFRYGTEPGLRGAVVTLNGDNRILTFKNQAGWTFS
jgi:hypothetical protein